MCRVTHHPRSHMGHLRPLNYINPSTWRKYDEPRRPRPGATVGPVDRRLPSRFHAGRAPATIQSPQGVTSQLPGRTFAQGRRAAEPTGGPPPSVGRTWHPYSPAYVSRAHVTARAGQSRQTGRRHGHGPPERFPLNHPIPPNPRSGRPPSSRPGAPGSTPAANTIGRIHHIRPDPIHPRRPPWPGCPGRNRENAVLQ